MGALMRCLLVSAILCAAGAFASSPAQAAVSVSIEPAAKLLPDGAVRVVLVASCDEGHDVLEAFVSVSQDDQSISGRAGIPLRCTGRPRTYRVRVKPLEGSFHAGEAYASAYVLTCADPPTCSTTEQGQAARTITVR